MRPEKTPELIDVQKRSAVRRISSVIIGGVLALTLMCELYVLCGYFSFVSLFMLPHMGAHETWKVVAFDCHILAAVLYFAAIFGVTLCFLGIISHRAPVMWFLVTLSILGMITLPIALYNGLDAPNLVQSLYYLEGLSMLLFINTPAAFRYMKLRRLGR
jgi:cation transport ATPase